MELAGDITLMRKEIEIHAIGDTRYGSQQRILTWGYQWEHGCRKSDEISVTRGNCQSLLHTTRIRMDGNLWAVLWAMTHLLMMTRRKPSVELWRGG